jgi:hypothetical protein
MHLDLHFQLLGLSVPTPTCSDQSEKDGRSSRDTARRDGPPLLTTKSVAASLSVISGCVPLNYQLLVE